MKSRFVRWLALIVFVVTLLTPILKSKQAKAQILTPNDVIATWTDASTIEVSSKSMWGDSNPRKFFDNKLDGNWKFENEEKSCGSILAIDSEATGNNATSLENHEFNNPGDFSRAYLLVHVGTGNQQTGFRCEVKYGEERDGPDRGAPVSLGFTASHKINYYFTNGGTNLITSDVNSDWAFEKCTDKDVPNCDNKWFRVSESGENCRDVIELTGTWQPRDAVLPTGYRQEFKGNPPCEKTGTKIDVFFGNVVTSQAPPSGSGATDSQQSTGVGSSGTGQPTCESTGFSLSWIVCPIINGIADAADAFFDNVIRPLLVTRTSGLTDPNNPTFKVWSSFRIIANVLLVLFLLVAVFGQAFGGGLVDAYTAKKIMPRILVTAILINLSIYIVAVAVDLTNILGSGLANLIYLPFKNAGQFHFSVAGTTSGLAIVGGGLGIAVLVNGFFAAGAALAGAASSFILLFVLVPAILAIVGTFLTLVIRQGLIILLIMVAPIAFALYCLPNTEKYFKKWWDLLFKTLMVYPLIIAIFAIADVLIVAADLGNNGGFAKIVTDFVQVVLLVLPLFLIPFAFKLVGGAVTAIFGAISGVGKKGHEALLGNPNDQDSLRNRTRRNFGIQRRIGGWTGVQINSALNPRQVTAAGRRRGQAHRRTLRQVGLQQFRSQIEQTPLWAAVQGDSNVTRELAWYENAGQATEAANNWRAQALAAPGANAPEVERQYRQRLTAIAAAERVGYNPASRRAALLNPYQVGFEMEAGEQGWNHAISIMDSIAGGDEFQFRSLMDEFQAVAKSPGVGRVDLAANTDGDRTYRGTRAWGSGGLYEIGNGKPRAITGGADYFSGLTQRIAANSLDVRDQEIVTEAQERGVDPRVVATEAVGTFYSETTQLAQSAKGAARDEAIRQRRRIGELINNTPGLNPFVAQATTGLTNLPNNKADALARSPEVVLKSRSYETPDRIAQQQGGPTPPTPPPPPVPSDRRLKTQVRHIHTLENGIKLYSFKYVWGGPTYVGVMAQELQLTHPEAVSKNKYGYFQVDYELLGLQMLTIDQWNMQQKANEPTLSS